MKKLAMGIAAASLAAVSMSANAWWGPGYDRNYGGYAPYYAYAPYGHAPTLTEEQITAQKEAIEAQQKAALEHFQRMEEQRKAMRGPMTDGPFGMRDPMGEEHFQQMQAQREAMKKAMEERRKAMRGPMTDGPFGMRDPMGEEHFQQMQAQREAMKKAMEERRKAMRGPMTDGPFGMRDPMGEEHFKQMEAQRLAMQESMDAQRKAMQKSFEERMQSRQPRWDDRYGPVR